MMRIELFGLIAVLCIGVYGESRQCYKCRDETDPLKSDCWNNTDKENAVGIEIVTCDFACYSEAFQSAGEFWYVEKGCKEDCSGSKNCKGPHWGQCTRCCKGELCNTDAPNTAAAGVAVSVVLSMATLLMARFI